MKQSPTLSPATFYLIGCFFLLALLAGCSSPPPAEPPSEARMDNVFGSGSVTVYPVMVRTSTIAYDHQAPQTFAGFFRLRTKGGVVVSAEEIQCFNQKYGTPRPTWQIIQDSVRTHLVMHPLRTDFGAFAVYVFPPGISTASNIHVMLFDGQGNVRRRFDIDNFGTPPRSPAECTQLVMAVIRQREETAASAR